MKSLTGQYECNHKSGVGLDYFTARLDRLTLLTNGRFVLITQEKSRLMHAAKSLASGQQATIDSPEDRQEGNYSSQGNALFLTFDDNGQEEAEVLPNGLQFGQDFFEKVSDSTFIPPQQRLKSNMEDIAKGLKIASAIGGTMFKAAKTLQDTFQTSQSSPEDAQQQGAPGMAQQTGRQPVSPAPQNRPAVPVTPVAQPQAAESLFCDQCGSPVRPGKKFCRKCGAPLE